MATIWITYAWDDNTSGDVDFIAQELESCGIHVRLDKWTIGAGKRLWEQIDSFIRDPSHCDAWVLYATQASLGSEACKEEVAYALERALKARTAIFPIVGLFPESVDGGLIPGAISTRLHVSTKDPDWRERIKAAAEGRSVQIPKANLEPYELKVHRINHPHYAYSIEVRPRAGTWGPFFFAIPAREQINVALVILSGPRGLPVVGGLNVGSEATSPDGWFAKFSTGEATPTLSFYANCKVLPSAIRFGCFNGKPQFGVSLYGKV